MCMHIDRIYQFEHLHIENRLNDRLDYSIRLTQGLAEMKMVKSTSGRFRCGADGLTVVV